MIPFHEYVATDGVGWAARVRAKEADPLELADAAIARAEAVNGEVKAIAAKVYDGARAAAKGGLSGPLAGVPWVMKDLFQTIEGVPVTNGSRAFAGVVGREDALLTRRYKSAGLNVVATSTAPELGLAAVTESSLYGATRNPWDLGRTPGGSSGGSSALVASGVVPAAHATDGGGSIRGPAACCGLFGMKPSRGRVPVAVGRTEGWLGCSTTHAVSRSVRDSAVLLDVSAGPEPGSRYVAPPFVGTCAEAVGRDPGRLRIAWHTRTRDGVAPHPDCVAAVEDAARLCEGLGHHVEEAVPDVDFDATATAFGVGVLASLASLVRGRAGALGRETIDDLLEQTTVEYVRHAAGFTGQHILSANETFMAAALAMAEFQERWDVILTPTMGRPPIPIGEGSMQQSAQRFDAATKPFSCFTSIYNCTGQPAMTVPLFWSAEGLPIGTQFAARVGEEELLYSLAGQLERARPWFDRRPRLKADA